MNTGYSDVKGQSACSYKKVRYRELCKGDGISIQVEERDEQQQEKHYLFTIKNTRVYFSDYKVLIGKDITLLGTVSEGAEERANEQLYQVQRVGAVGQLTGGIAHDFNNILTGIISAASLLNLNEGNELSQENLKYVDMIPESIQ